MRKTRIILPLTLQTSGKAQPLTSNKKYQTREKKKTKTRYRSYTNARSQIHSFYTSSMYFSPRITSHVSRNYKNRMKLTGKKLFVEPKVIDVTLNYLIFAFGSERERYLEGLIYQIETLTEQLMLDLKKKALAQIEHKRHGDVQ